MSTASSSTQHGNIMCPRCGTHTMQRDHRVGVLERVVFPWFRLYPWECVNCRTRKLFRTRGTRRRKSSSGS